MNPSTFDFNDGSRGEHPGDADDTETIMSNAETSRLAFLPDAANHNTDPSYIRGLLERANISMRGSARILGLAEQSMRNFLSGKSSMPYAVQYCLEVLARGGVADAPDEATTWYRTAQRPLRPTDAGRLVVGRHAGELVLGRVKHDAYGVTVEVQHGGVDSRMLGATAFSEYTLFSEIAA